MPSGRPLLLPECAQCITSASKRFLSTAPSTLPKVTGRQNLLWQQGVSRHRIEPGQALCCHPSLHCLRSLLISQRPDRPLTEHLQILSVADIDSLEVPRACNDFFIRFACEWPRLEQDKGFHVDLSASENPVFLLQWVRRDPHTVLQVTEASVAQVAP